MNTKSTAWFLMEALVRRASLFKANAIFHPDKRLAGPEEAADACRAPFLPTKTTPTPSRAHDLSARWTKQSITRQCRLGYPRYMVQGGDWGHLLRGRWVRGTGNIVGWCI
ncbi:uncharacterized protein BDW70DRAFT_136276 [Aspergillus foveolatus]|uniref:uncharacterized protein n=1 Tax=Aspergillus foveolatus TaxID=210207 RepID=UPI003CCD273E